MGLGIPDAVLDPGRLAAVAATGLAANGIDEQTDAAFERLARLAAIILEAPLAFLTIVDEEHAWYRAAVGLPTDAARCGAVEGSFCKYVIASQEALVVSDARSDPRTRGNPAIDDMGVVAWAGHPVIDAEGQVLGSFCVVDTVPRQWTDAQLESLRVLALAANDRLLLRTTIEAERRASAEAAALRGREHQLVAQFQRALLPRSLPEANGFATAVRYIAPDDSARIGGDWYDLIALDGGGTGFVVGDVCGHDIDAVTVMSQLRHTTHVLALTEPDPWAVVDLVDSSMDSQEVDRFASFVFARWDPPSQTLAMVNAGHPPPLFVRDGSVELLGGGRRPLVGVGAGIVEGQPAQIELGPGDVVVMFTDGLVERRNSTLDDDLERLRVTVADLSQTNDPERLCDQILAAMLPENGWEDDVALLVFRRTSQL